MENFDVLRMLKEQLEGKYPREKSRGRGQELESNYESLSPMVDEFDVNKSRPTNTMNKYKDIKQGQNIVYENIIKHSASIAEKLSEYNTYNIQQNKSSTHTHRPPNPIINQILYRFNCIESYIELFAKEEFLECLERTLHILQDLIETREPREPNSPPRPHITPKSPMKKLEEMLYTPEQLSERTPPRAPPPQLTKYIQGVSPKDSTPSEHSRGLVDHHVVRKSEVKNMLGLNKGFGGFGGINKKVGELGEVPVPSMHTGEDVAGHSPDVEDYEDYEMNLLEEGGLKVVEIAYKNTEDMRDPEDIYSDTPDIVSHGATHPAYYVEQDSNSQNSLPLGNPNPSQVPEIKQPIIINQYNNHANRCEYKSKSVCASPLFTPKIKGNRTHSVSEERENIDISPCFEHQIRKGGLMLKKKNEDTQFLGSLGEKGKVIQVFNRYTKKKSDYFDPYIQYGGGTMYYIYIYIYINIE